MLKSKKILLSTILEKDSNIMFNWINDRNLVLFNSHYRPVSYQSHKDWFSSIQNKEDLIIFGIRLIEANKLIGTCQLRFINFIDRNAELQIRIGDNECLGKGFGTEAVKLLVEFGFKDLNLNKIYLYVFNNNQRAINSYKKAGFSKEGILKDHSHIDGNYIDVLIMGKIRNHV